MRNSVPRFLKPLLTVCVFGVMIGFVVYMNIMARNIQRHEVQIQHWDHLKEQFDQKQEAALRKVETDREILIAIQADSPQRLAAFFPHGVPATERIGNAPLAKWAVDADAEKVLAALMDQGMDVNTRDAAGKTLLIEAALTAHPASMKYLLLHGADVNAKDQEGRTALMDALGDPQNSAIAYLDPQAATHHREATVRLLLEHGADINSADKRGWTPLIYIVGKGDVGTARLLLEHGANVNAIALNGYSPVMAASGGEMLQLLLDKGANVNQAEKGVGTPLHWARKGKRKYLISLLLKAGARDEAP